jgi:hypothetical protein
MDQYLFIRAPDSSNHITVRFSIAAPLVIARYPPGRPGEPDEARSPNNDSQKKYGLESGSLLPVGHGAQPMGRR